MPQRCVAASDTPTQGPRPVHGRPPRSVSSSPSVLQGFPFRCRLSLMRSALQNTAQCLTLADHHLHARACLIRRTTSPGLGLDGYELSNGGFLCPGPSRKPRPGCCARHLPTCSRSPRVSRDPTARSSTTAATVRDPQPAPHPNLRTSPIETSGTKTRPLPHAAVERPRARTTRRRFGRFRSTGVRFEPNGATGCGGQRRSNGKTGTRMSCKEGSATWGFRKAWPDGRGCDVRVIDTGYGDEHGHRTRAGARCAPGGRL